MGNCITTQSDIDISISYNPNHTILEEYSQINDDYDLCVLCRDNFNDCDSIMIYECKHFFHIECIQQYLNNVIDYKCPICKKENKSLKCIYNELINKKH